MDAQLPLLQQKIRDEDVVIALKSVEFVTTWEAKRPVDGITSTALSLSILISVQFSFSNR